MRRLLGRFLVLFSLTTTLGAETPDPAKLTAPPDENTISSYLQSGDPRLIAWGATFTLQTRNTNLIPDLTRLSSNWPSTNPSADSGSRARSYEMQAVLDALIQLQAVPTAEAIEPVANDFPEQALILLSRQSPAEIHGVLFRLYQTSPSDSWLKLGTAAMLAQDPRPDFVADLLKGLRVDIHVSVLSPTSPSFGSSGSEGSCIVSKLPVAPQGWPTLYHYDLFQNGNPSQDGSEDSHEDGLFTVVRRPDTVVARRTIDPATPTLPRYCISPFTRESPQELINLMLNYAPETQGWRSDSLTIRATSVADYSMLLGNLVTGYQARVQATLSLLQKRGLLRPEDTEVRPTIRFLISDERNGDTLSEPLPIPKSSDPYLKYADYCSDIRPIFSVFCMDK